MPRWRGTNLLVRAFVTGGTGFIGGHLCRRLIERGDEVVALLRSKAKAARLHDNPGSLAASPSRRPSRPRDRPLRRARGRRPTLRRPSRNKYGRAKAKAEELVARAPFPTTSFRPPIVLGPGDEATLTLFKSARGGVGFRVAGKPQELSFVDVRDLVDAIVLMADDPRPGHFLYFASHPSAFDVRELWTELARAVGRPVFVVPVPRPLLFVAARFSTVFSKLLGFKNQLDDKQYHQMVAPAFVCSSERLRSDLGFQPKYGLAETLSNAAQGYREAGWLS